MTTLKRKVMVYLDQKQAAYLERYHEAHGTPMTEVVRRALNEYEARHPIAKETENATQQQEL